MAEHRYTASAVCPQCGHVEHDSWEYDFGPGLEGDGEVTCNSCGEEFFCSRHVSVTYSTRPIAGVRVDDAPQPGAYVAHAQEVRKLLEGEAPPDFCDGHCTWLDHHPDCPRARGVPPTRGGEQ